MRSAFCAFARTSSESDDERGCSRVPSWFRGASEGAPRDNSLRSTGLQTATPSGAGLYIWLGRAAQKFGYHNP
eukprot:10722261-Alexandrium_andersonii.AAC.1